MKAEKQIILPRRTFLQQATTTAILATTAASPLAQALSWRDVRHVLKLNLVRFIAGLIFDVIEVVVVDYFRTHYNGRYEYYAGLPDDRNHFDHNRYREAVIQIHPVVLGMSEAAYAAYRAQRTQVVLSRDEDQQRFAEIIRYLVDSKTRLLRPTDNVSTRITARTVPTELFNGDLIFRDAESERHYQTLLERTGVTVFDRMAV